MRPSHRLSQVLIATALAAATVTGCGSSDDGASGGDDRPSIVVTMNVLGDVVTSLLGDHADVTTVMPAGASPHDFQVSARQAQSMREADLLIVNGGGFEAGVGAAYQRRVEVVGRVVA